MSLEYFIIPKTKKATKDERGQGGKNWDWRTYATMYMTGN